MLRYLAARGDQAGQRAQGRMRDYLFVLSAMRDRTLYRRREIAPVRRVHLVIDVRDFSEGADDRLTEGAGLVGGLLLGMPSVQLTLSAWGTRDGYPQRAFAGTGQWPMLRQVIAGMADLPVEPPASTGALLRAVATDEPSFLVLVTSWIEPDHVAGLMTPFGGTCFLMGVTGVARTNSSLK